MPQSLRRWCCCSSLVAGHGAGHRTADQAHSRRFHRLAWPMVQVALAVLNSAPQPKRFAALRCHPGFCSSALDASRHGEPSARQFETRASVRVAPTKCVCCSFEWGVCRCVLCVAHGGPVVQIALAVLSFIGSDEADFLHMLGFFVFAGSSFLHQATAARPRAKAPPLCTELRPRGRQLGPLGGGGVWGTGARGRLWGDTGAGGRLSRDIGAWGCPPGGIGM